MKNRDVTKRIIDIVEYQFDERYITIGYSYDDILPFEERFVNTDNTRRSYY